MIKKNLINGMGQIVINNDVLDALRKAVGGRYITQVGILGQKAAGRQATGALSKSKGEYTGGHRKAKKDSDLTNADIGAKHEFGVQNEKERLQMRSFLRMPLLRSSKELFERKQKLVLRIKGAIENGTSIDDAWLKAFQDLGIIAQQIVQGSFEQGGPGWPALSKTTIERKKSDKILIDTAQLRRSISSRVVKA
jgi:hypothetical protein